MAARSDRRGTGIGGDREGRQRSAARDHGRAPGAEVQLSPAARSDLLEIREYSIARFDPDTADAYFLGFDDAFDLLSNHPRVGSRWPELGKGVRCLIHRRQHIFCRAEKQVAIILRIIHHARDAKGAMKGAD